MLIIQTATTNKSGLTLFLSPLGGTFANSFTKYGLATDPLRSASIDSNVLTLEFSPQAFDKDDRVIFSAGNISGGYNDTANTVTVTSLTPINTESFKTITDPAGKTLSTSNSSTSSNITINDSQKISVAQ